MSFFKKLKDRMFRSSDKIGEGLEALVSEETAPEAAPAASAAPTAPLVTDPGSAPAASSPEPDRPGLIGRLLGRTEEPRRVLDLSLIHISEPTRPY